MAERKNKSASPAAEPAEAAERRSGRTYTEEEVQAMIASILAKQKPEDEVVRMYYLAVCAPTSEADLPGYGVLRPGQYLEVPKKEFGGKFMSPQARLFIRKRRLLVLDGLSDEERQRWNCDYKRGEILTEDALDHLLDMPLPEVETLFSALGKEHKVFVARYINTIVDEANRNGEPIDNRISLELLRALNEASKKDVPDGLFTRTVELFKAML